MKRILIALFAMMAVVLARAETWEYASFGLSVTNGVPEYSWVKSENAVGTAAIDELAKKLVELGVIPAVPAKVTVAVMLDQLGAQGWEMVQYTGERTRDGFFERYRFKRKTSEK